MAFARVVAQGTLPSVRGLHLYVPRRYEIAANQPAASEGKCWCEWGC